MPRKKKPTPPPLAKLLPIEGGRKPPSEPPYDRPDPATAAKLAFVVEEEAQRMVAAWASVPKFATRPATIRAWAAISGVAEVRAKRFAPQLWGNGICRPDRTTMPEALAFVAAAAVGGRRR